MGKDDQELGAGARHPTREVQTARAQGHSRRRTGPGLVPDVGRRSLQENVPRFEEVGCGLPACADGGRREYRALVGRLLWQLLWRL